MRTYQRSIREVAGGFLAIMGVIAIALTMNADANSQVMNGDKYSITSSVVANGGGTSTGDNKKIEGTIGQSAAGGPHSGGTFSHDAGFWFTASNAAAPTPSPSPTPPPAFGLSISDVTQVEGNSGTSAFIFLVSLSNLNNQTVTVNYTTVNGSADGNDYQFANGLVTFSPGELSKPVVVLVNGDTDVEPNDTFFVSLTNALNATITKGQGTGTILNDDASSPTTAFQFAQPTYNVQEDLGALTVTVIRTGDTSAASTVDYKTVDGGAMQKSDFEYAAGTLTFAPGETGKTFRILLNEDMYLEGKETFSLALSNPTGAVLGAQSTAGVNISDDAPEALANPIDDAQTFVYVHYHDFLNREPDTAGLAFWTNQITSCNGDAQCMDVARANVSAAFYLSIEFQQTGYLLYLMQRESFATRPQYAAFLRDLQEISRDVIVNSSGWQQKLTDNQQHFAEKWANRAEFKAIYDGMSNTDFVNALYANAGIAVNQTDRDALVARLDGANETRSSALLEVAANATFRQKEMNSAFVLMEYFGYLRRDPSAIPDIDLSGYDYWLNKLNKFGGNYLDAEMVRAFIVSLEYRQRFGQ